MSRDCLNLIDGRWVPARSGRTLDSIDPAQRTDVVATCPRSEAADVSDAVKAAVAAFTGWRRVPAPERADYVLRMALLLEERIDELSMTMSREMGKTLNEARGDVQEGIDFALYVAGEGRRSFGYTIPSELPNKRSMSIRQPVGVVGLITPWNFPVAIPLWKICPAIVAGCTSVFKPAEDTPLMATLLAELFEEVGLPPGVLNVVHGYGWEAGAPLVEHPDVRGISFTGSLEVGRWVHETCGRLMKRCALELGGKNALILMPDADLDVAVEAAAWGAFATSGQRCSTTARLIVHEDIKREFLERLVPRAEAMRLGSGVNPEVDMAPVVSEKQRDRVLEYIEIGIAEGAAVVTGGVAASAQVGDGFYVAPTILDNVQREMRVAQEEIFGPVTTIISVSSLDEAIDVANDSQYGLTCSIYTRDLTSAFEAIERLEFGVVYVNAPTIGAEMGMPFGGVKLTGNGHREAGPQAIDEFTEWKTVSIDFSGRLQKAQSVD